VLRQAQHERDMVRPLEIFLGEGASDVVHRGGAKGKAMARLTRSLRFVATGLVSLFLAVQPVAAQSILRDAETEQFLQEISAGMAKSAGLSPARSSWCWSATIRSTPSSPAAR
jgi:hypothetical protein